MADELKTLSVEEIESAKKAQAELEAKTVVTLIDKVSEVNEVVIPSDLKVSEVKVPSPKEVAFKPLDGSEDRANIDTYNQTAKTLQDSVNTEFVSFGKSVQESVNKLGDEVGKVNANIRESTNSALGSIRKDANKGLADLFGEIKKLKEAHDATQTKIAGLDAVFASDVDISDKVGKTLKILDELSGVNTEFFDNFKTIVDRINQTEITTNKRFKITSKEGTANFNLRLNDMGEFTSADEYIAKIESLSVKGVEAFITKSDADGFDIELISKRYLVDKPHNAEAEAVEVVVSVSHALRSPFLIGDSAGSNKIVTSNEVGA